MNLQEFFAENPRVAIAFSGGVDSSYLLYAALHYGARARAYYVNSAFQPAFELEDARRLAGELNADMKVLPVDVLASETVTANPPDRCYHCKQMIFRTILAAAEADGFTVLLDGTNASDDAGRPARYAGPAGAVGALSPAGVWPDQGGMSARCPGTQDCLPGTSPHTPAWPPASPPDSPLRLGTLAVTEAAERDSVLPGLHGFSGARWCGRSAKIQLPGRPDAKASGAPAGDFAAPGAGL